jgi:hypothetical protein
MKLLCPYFNYTKMGALEDISAVYAGSKKANKTTS